MPLAHNTNSLLYDHAPQIFERIRSRGDEIVAHGRTNSENLQDFRWEEDEARVIREVTETFARNEGKRPKGWMGAGTYENSWTPDLLKEAGYDYIMDWPHDDQPIWMRTRAGPILSVPYPAELNDSPQIIHRQHTGREFCDMLVDQFEEMVEQSEKHPLVCNISIHPYVFGYPFRLRPLRKALKHCFSSKFMDRVWKCKPEEVSDYCRELCRPGRNRAVTGRVEQHFAALDLARDRARVTERRNVNRMRAGSAGDDDADVVRLDGDGEHRVGSDFTELRAARVLGAHVGPWPRSGSRPFSTAPTGAASRPPWSNPRAS